MIIDGKKIAKEIRLEMASLISKHKTPPGLAFILIGDNPASEVYVRMKKRACEDVGIKSQVFTLPKTISQDKLIIMIEKMNQDPSIDGILVQLPLPHHIDSPQLMQCIDPKKDVDGFHPINMGKLLTGIPGGFVPCTPLGIQMILTRSQVKIEGKHVVILGRSNIVGKPLAALLMQKKEAANASVTVLHSLSENLHSILREADILVAALGRPHFVKKDMIKDKAVVIDVGINRIDNHLVGDADFDNIKDKCSYITPVPGGVGPMTIAMLLSNTLLSYQRKQ